MHLSNLFGKSKEKNSYLICVNLCALLLCMVVALICCCNKYGFHEDEYYTYYSSNRTDGFWVEDGATISRDTILREFMVVPGEGFNFSLVKQVQSWDVHPPIYYFVIHFVSSITPGLFSMWQGLGINLVCFLICLILMKLLGDSIFKADSLMSTLVTVAWGFSAATLTSVVFIRMYMMLTLWILAVSLLHAKEYEKHQGVWFYIVLAILTFLGFMTHYYFFIWLFCLALFFNLRILLVDRKLKPILLYLATMIVSFGCSYLFYPAWPAQMFRGQRGAQATGNFVDISNTFSRLSFFAEIVNRIGFGGISFILIALLVCLLLAGLFLSNKAKENREQLRDSKLPLCLIFLGAGLGYFCIVSKTALMLGDSSIRYQTPILGVEYIALFAGIMILTELFAKNLMALKGIVFVLIICNGMSILGGNISFLYPEEKDHIELISQYPEATTVYAFNPDPSSVWCVWASTEELLVPSEVYFTSGDMTEAISDEDIAHMGDADQIILYVDDGVDKEALLNKIKSINSKISTTEPGFTHKFCEMYICK